MLSLEFYQTRVQALSQVAQGILIQVAIKDNLINEEGKYMKAAWAAHVRKTCAKGLGIL